MLGVSRSTGFTPRVAETRTTHDGSVQIAAASSERGLARAHVVLGADLEGQKFGESLCGFGIIVTH
jgi:hypothetical protein